MRATPRLHREPTGRQSGGSHHRRIPGGTSLSRHTRRRTTGRVIAIGDIHGCAREFELLLEKLALTPDDRLILLGDLVNRGPDSARVLALARQHAHHALLGNHELRLLHYRRTGNPAYLKRYDYDTLRQLTDADWAYLASMSLTYHVPEFNTVLVHAGFAPGRPWQSQPADTVTQIQVAGPNGEAFKRSERPGEPHWSEVWGGPQFVIYGHTPQPQPAVGRWTLGIDTACVQGGALTACILSDRTLVQVPALAA
jgi:serine/threonine protein phosphatase 1